MEDDHITLPYDQPAPTANPQDFYQNQSCDMGQNKLEFPAPQPHITPQQPPQNMFQHQQHFAPPQPPQQPQFQPQQPQIFNQQLAPVPVQQSAPYQQEQTYRGTTSYKIDEEAIIAAQKHAKWAVSALNFEDVDTAVKELRIALRALGAS
jgi:vacuolar protein sorting-associated protein VTA1